MFVCYFCLTWRIADLYSQGDGKGKLFLQVKGQSNLTGKYFIASSQKQLLSSVLLVLHFSCVKHQYSFFSSSLIFITNIVCFSLCTEPFLSMLMLSLWTAAGFVLQTAILHWRSWGSVCDTSPTQLSSALCFICCCTACQHEQVISRFSFISVFFLYILTCWCFTFSPTWKPIWYFFVWDVTVNSSCSYCSFNVKSILFSNQASMMSLIKMKLTVMWIFPDKIHWPSCYLVKSVLWPHFRTRNNQKHYKFHPYISVQDYVVGHSNSLLGQLSDGSYGDLILSVLCTFLYKWFILEQTLQQVHANPQHKFSFCYWIYWKTL